MRWYDIALWRYWPSLFPEYVCYIQAPSAFAAVEATMRHYKRCSVAYASARALDGSIVYRCYHPRVVLLAEMEP